MFIHVKARHSFEMQFKWGAIAFISKSPISAQNYLSKMQATSSFLPSFSLPKHGHVKKALNFVLQPHVLYGHTQLIQYFTYIRHVENLSHMSKLRERWLLLCSRTVSYTDNALKATPLLN